MPLTNYPENVNNSPYGLANTNAPGSPYAAAYGRGTTSHLKLAVEPVIFDAQPKQFLDLQFLMAYASEQGPSDEVIWKELLWGRVAPQFGANFVGVVAIPGSTVDGTITLTAGTIGNTYPGQKMTYGSGATQTQATVISKVGNTAVIRSMNGKALGAATNGDRITNGMTAGGDGGQFYPEPTRTATVERYNLVERIGPESQFWNEWERAKFKALEQTDFMATDAKQVIYQLKVSLCQRIWFGQMGETTLSDGRIVKMTEGIVPAILNNGGALLNATMATVWDTIITGAFNTNFGSTSNERVVYATQEMLTAINMKAKAEYMRYTGADKTYEIDFEEWRIGGMKFTFVPVQIWGDEASFPKEYQRRLVIMQKENTKLYSPTWAPMIKTGLVTASRYNTPATQQAIYDYERFTCEGAVCTKTKGAAMSYIIDVA